MHIGNGFIPTSSLKEILAAMDDQLTDEQLLDIIAEIDTDGSGTVDFDGMMFLNSVLFFYVAITLINYRIYGNDDRRLKMRCDFALYVEKGAMRK